MSLPLVLDFVSSPGDRGSFRRTSTTSDAETTPASAASSPSDHHLFISPGRRVDYVELEAGGW
jgi:hypothetical protein